MLRLIYKDTEGYDRTADIGDGEFVIGRLSSCDLCIPSDRLSRQHLSIQKFNGTYYAEDTGSSNGTKLNGSEIYEQTELHDGDVLDLGGGAKIKVSFVKNQAETAATTYASDHTMMKTGTFKRPDLPAATVSSANTVTASSSENKSGIPTFVYLAAPLAAIMLLVFAGGAIYLFSNSSSANNTTSSRTDDYDDPIDIDDKPNKSKSNDTVVSEPTGGNSDSTGTPTGANNGTNANSNSNDAPLPPQNSGIAKVEHNAASFMRSIAENDPRAFLTGEQAGRVNAKIDELKGSASLAANIESARKNSSQIAALAKANNLKPRFVAVAAIAKLGKDRGDVLETARSQMPVFEKLLPQIGTEFADDAMLMIAAFEQGKSGQHMKMRNMLQGLAEKSSESSRSIRTIWFLSKNNNITGAEFESALNFLAIGTITQNPKDFGINAEALN